MIETIAADSNDAGTKNRLQMAIVLVITACSCLFAAFISFTLIFNT
jgi:hypothetical protein